MCSCGICQNSTATLLKLYHHTNIDNVLYRLESGGGKVVRIVFTGREMCKQGQYSHIPNLSNSDTFCSIWKDRNVVLLKDFETEVNHDAMMLTVGVLLLYGLNNHSDAGLSDCVLGSNANSTSVRTDCVICSDCLNVLRANADKYSN